LGDETTFALMVEVLPHMITMVSEINNLPGLNAILHGVNIGQQTPSLQQSQPILQRQFGESSNLHQKIHGFKVRRI
jgi:hypothetical protein